MSNSATSPRASLAACVLVSLLTLPGCTELGSGVVGGPGSGANLDDGPVVERTRQVGPLTGVVLSAVGALHVSQGGAPSLRILAGERVHEQLQTEVVGGALVVRFVGGTSFQNSGPIEYHLTVPDLDYAELASVGTIQFDGFGTDDLELVLSGVGNINGNGLDVAHLDVVRTGEGSLDLEGVVGAQAVELGGNGDYVAEGLVSSIARITNTSTGSATVRVRDRLEAMILGSGSVYYIGDPAVERSGDGSGTVERIG